MMNENRERAKHEITAYMVMRGIRKNERGEITRENWI
jgi:hypothetical protein